MSSQSNITLILSPTCTTEHILYTTATLDWYTYWIWPYTVILFVIHNHVLHHRHNRTYAVYINVTLHRHTYRIWHYTVTLFVVHNQTQQNTYCIQMGPYTDIYYIYLQNMTLHTYISYNVCNSQPHPAPQTPQNTYCIQVWPYLITTDTTHKRTHAKRHTDMTIHSYVTLSR